MPTRSGLCQGGLDPSNLNVETCSIAPDEVKRGGKLIEVREPRTISLVLGILICISFPLVL